MTPDNPVAGLDPADLTDAFNRVADRLEEVKRDSEKRDTDEADARSRQGKALKHYGRINRRLVIIDIVLTVIRGPQRVARASRHPGAQREQLGVPGADRGGRRRPVQPEPVLVQ